MTPQQIIFLSIVGIALVALIFLSESQKRYNLDSIKRKTVGDGQYGTARWATQEEIQSSTIQVPYERKRGDTTKKAARLPQASSLI